MADEINKDEIRRKRLARLAAGNSSSTSGNSQAEEGNSSNQGDNLKINIGSPRGAAEGSGSGVCRPHEASSCLSSSPASPDCSSITITTTITQACGLHSPL
ncbi:hypothetical protein FHG87_016484 [Trinorchestia longiramus]|nr:hypothetical protein FHG87_016484 [Trinorchestia longiramus]